MDSLTIRHLEVGRTARLAVLGAQVERPAEFWLALHGYRQLADRFLRPFSMLDDGSRRVVAPEALSRFYIDEDGGPHGLEHRVGATWMTRHDREAEIGDYVRYLDRVVESEGLSATTRRVALGFSQGVHTLTRWVVLGRTPVPDTVVLWGAGLPIDLDEGMAARRLASTRLIVVHGRRDRHRNPDTEAADARRLDSWGVDVRRIEHPGGHRIDPAVLLELAAGS